jgi:hypothetical protein
MLAVLVELVGAVLVSGMLVAAIMSCMLGVAGLVVAELAAQLVAELAAQPVAGLAAVLVSDMLVARLVAGFVAGLVAVLVAGMLDVDSLVAAMFAAVYVVEVMHLSSSL